MPLRSKKYLLVANLYDAYAIEGEGRFAEHILGEYYQLNLTNVPRVTGVSGEEEVFSKLRSRHYDMIIIMFGVDKENPIKLISKIKKKYPYIPSFLLLLSSPSDVPIIKGTRKKD